MKAFRAIFAHPGTPLMSAAGFVGRFPMGMIGLAVTMLVVGATGSYGLAGGVAAATTVSSAVGGPVGARLADRFGQHRVIPPLITVQILSMVGLTLAVLAGTPVIVWFALAAMSGLTGPNLGAMVRTRWAGITHGSTQLTSAFAFESMLDEVAFVVGPPLATALAVTIAPWSAIATALVLAALGSGVLAAQRRTEPMPAPHARVSGEPIWRSRVLQILTVLMILMGAIFGALEVATVAFAQENSVVGATGWLLGSFALASMITGLYLGARPGDWLLTNQIWIGSAMLAATCSILPFLGSPWFFGVGMFATGLGVSAVMIGTFQLIERAVDRSRLTESLALSGSGLMIGTSAAVALAGALIDAKGAAWGVGVGSAAAVLGLVLVSITRGALARCDHQ